MLSGAAELWNVIFISLYGNVACVTQNKFSFWAFTSLGGFCCGMYWYMLTWHDDMIKSLSLLQALVFGDAILDAITLQQVDRSQIVNMRAES